MGTNCEVEVNNCEQQPCANGGTCKVGPGGGASPVTVWCHQYVSLSITRSFPQSMAFYEIVNFHFVFFRLLGRVSSATALRGTLEGDATSWGLPARPTLV